MSALGWTYNNVGHLHEALEYHSQALPIRRELRDQLGQAQTLNSIGHIYMSAGESEKAIGHCRIIRITRAPVLFRRSTPEENHDGTGSQPAW